MPNPSSGARIFSPVRGSGSQLIQHVVSHSCRLRYCRGNTSYEGLNLGYLAGNWKETPFHCLEPENSHLCVAFADRRSNIQ